LFSDRFLKADFNAHDPLTTVNLNGLIAQCKEMLITYVRCYLFLKPLTHAAAARKNKEQIAIVPYCTAVHLTSPNGGSVWHNTFAL
jgi:hypothetical protein